MQKLIMKFTGSEFLKEVQDLLDNGWSVVPGTLIIHDSLRGTTTRYIVTLESPEKTDVIATPNYP